MKKLLFVVPSLHNGGTISVLKNLLPFVNISECSIDIFPITNSGPNYMFLSNYARILGTRIVDDPQRKATIKERVKSLLFLIVKLIKKGLCIIGFDISTLLFRQVAARLQNNGYDEVIAFQEGQVTRLVKWFKNVRKVAWVHCDYSRLDDKSIKKDKKLDVYSSFDTIICVSQYTRKKFLSLYPMYNNKTVAIYNVISSDTIRLKAEEKTSDSAFNVCNGARIVSLGRLHPVKQFSRIPEIAFKLQTKGLSFNWFIIGGEESDAKNIVDNIKRYNMEGIVKLLGNQNNPYPYIKNADLLVCTSLSEACPNVLNEAKVLGTPIVSTSFGSAKEILFDRKEGILTTLENMDDVIMNLLSNKELYIKIKDSLASFVYDNASILDNLSRVTYLRFKY